MLERITERINLTLTFTGVRLKRTFDNKIYE